MLREDLESVSLAKMEKELMEGIDLTKCRQCGCMKETLVALTEEFKDSNSKVANEVRKNLLEWTGRMNQIKYSCLGCNYCFPAVAMNIFNEQFPDSVHSTQLDCAFDIKENSWPAVPGEYKVLCKETNCNVAVSTLGSPELGERIANNPPENLCIIGKTETENIGIDKVIKNTITNNSIKVLLLVGNDTAGHYPGQTLLSLAANGIDEKNRIIGSKGKRPYLRNVIKEEIESFRKQVQVIDMIGCNDVEGISNKILELSGLTKCFCSNSKSDKVNNSTEISPVPIIQAKEPAKIIKLDKEGYFVILPQPENNIIIVEHYSYKDKLLKVIEGKDARSIYWTLIENNLVSLLSHSAYLGKELTKAELSMRYGFKYIQDGA